MKCMICGKGGSGKSTVTVLLARALAAAGKTVLVVDADESNLCLPLLLGMEQPAVMMEAMGGRPGAKEKLRQAAEHQHRDDFFKPAMTVDDLPADCIAEADGVRLLVVGKIRGFGEGCACMIGGITKAVLARLHEKGDEFVLVDAEAGLEHFGRQVDTNCDLVICVVDPSFESLQMAGRVREIAGSAGVQTYFILNKVDGEIREAMTKGFEPERIIAVLPRNTDLFFQSLHGLPLNVDIPEIAAACAFISSYRKPLSLSVKI